MTQDGALLKSLVQLAHEAGEAVMKIYATDFEVHQKGDHTPVTEADILAEEIILAGLDALVPGVPAVAEESFSENEFIASRKSQFWVIDPVDGTREFLDRNGEFTMNICLVEDTVPVCGVIHAPALDKTYYGSVGNGAFMQENGGAPRLIAARSVPADAAVTIAISRRHRNTDYLKELLGNRPLKDIVHMGSSLKFCLVASGEVDAYPRSGTTMEWDTGAGQAILEAAGGRVLRENGAPLRYAKEGFKNPPFVAWGNAV